MSDLSGIYSLRGFLYQLKIYELFALQHGWANSDVMTYEGLDDIDSKKTYLISTCRSFTQVKSGHLTKTIYYGVLSNWLLLNKKYPNSIFKLVYEQGDVASFKNDSFFEDYYNYISSSEMKKKHPDCKHSKACELFATKAEAMSTFVELNKRITYQQILEDEIYNLLLEEAKNQAITNEMMSKAFIFHFIDSLHNEIEDFIIKSKKYELTKRRFNEIRNATLSIVQRKKYAFNLKKFYKYELSDLESMADAKFYSQIKYVSEDSDFLFQNIIDELEYEIFKESYDDDESIEKIDHLEMSVHSRYMIMKANPKNMNNFDFYQCMIEGSYSSDILEMDESAKIGCCNYLTSSKADPSNAIKWKVFND